MLSRLHRLLRRGGSEADSSATNPGPSPLFHLLARSLSELSPDLSTATSEDSTPTLDTLDTLASEVDSEREVEHLVVVEADQLDALLAEDSLDFTRIAEARSLIAARPEEERPDLYRQLASKVAYRNQRDNEAKYGAADARAIGSSNAGDVMCNVTSLAMALEGLGLGADESEKQLEDQLDETLVEEGLGSRYELGGQSAAAKSMGAATERVWTPAFRGAAGAKDFYEKQVLPRLQRGETATLSMQWGAKGRFTHIVRLEWVTGDGLIVDDPYGRLLHNGSFFTYDVNEAQSAEGEGAKGEDRLWSWETAAAVNGGRYVQFLSVA